MTEEMTETQKKNKELVEKYPFLEPRNEFSGERMRDYDFSYTVLDDIPRGWKKAFGELLAEDIAKELENVPRRDEYYVLQAKEKYGSLRWYASISTKELDRINYKYEHISENTCIICGAYPVNVIDDGWVTPLCRKCFGDYYAKRWFSKKVPTEEETDAAYEKYSVEWADSVSPLFTIRRYSAKDGYADETVDCSDIIERIQKAQTAKTD